MLQSVDQDCTRKLLVVSRKPADGKNETSREDTPRPVQMDRYIIQRQVGEGAFGTVFQATDEILDRQVAVKVARRAADKEYLSEARTVAKLDHPNIVPVYDVGRTDEGQFCIISKFVEGSNLHRAAKKKKLSMRDSVSIVATVAEALGFAHLRAVIHRDVKPANILLDAHLRPFITDFGVATESRCSIRDGQYLAGTPLYMSPEQVECTSYLLDARSDIFSLGVVLYELLTGTVPFSADSIDELKIQIAQVKPKSPCELNPIVPTSLAAICMRAMAKQRDNRYQTAGEFAADLQKWLDQSHRDQAADPSIPEPCVNDDARPTTKVAKNLSGKRKSKKKLRLIIFAWIAAAILTPIVSIYGPQASKSWRQAQAVRSIERNGSTVVYDYQVGPDGVVDFHVPAPFLRDWSHRVSTVHLGAEIDSFQLDGEHVRVANRSAEHCSIEPLAQLVGLENIVLYQHLYPGELEILCTFSELKSIEFHFRPSPDEVEAIQEHLPQCEIRKGKEH